MDTFKNRQKSESNERRRPAKFVSLMAALAVLHTLCLAHTTNAFGPSMMPRRSVTGPSLGTPLTDSATTNHEKEDLIKIRAAVYQPQIEKERKGQKEDPLKVLKEIADVLTLASRCAIDLVQFPELFLNGGIFSDVVSGKSTPLDRESYALNIVGNLCAELNVACSIGYAESGHASEGNSSGCYSSMAIFHADGSRAGNYRCVHPPDSWKIDKGHPLVEAMPISLMLPTRSEAPTLQESIMVQEETETIQKDTKKIEIKVGAMCGGDLLVPEHARYLARSGANLLVVCGSMVNKTGSRMAQHILPARSMENELPLLFSNYVKEEETSTESFVGQSAILSTDGSELVRAPEHLDGDMPSDEGYFLPCETGGSLYAADLNLTVNNGGRESIGASVEQWDITPRIDQLSGSEVDTSKKGFQREQRKNSKGFGQDVMDVLEQSKKKKLRLKNTRK